MRQRLLIGAVVAMTLCGWYAAYRTVSFTLAVAHELTRASDLTSIAPRAQSTIVMDRRGHSAFSFYSEQRIDVSLDQVSRHMVQAIVAVEDRRFYSHYGLDPIRIVGAALRNLRAGRVREGGSTITQQLARASRLSPARTFERKLREAMLALQLERRYSKAQILQEYLNTVYFGEGFYGVEAAARGYFWFVGYTPHLVGGVWFGFDAPAPIMSRGFAGVVAVPAWARFMKAATIGAHPDWYEIPADVEKVAICRMTGARAADGCRHATAETVAVSAPAVAGLVLESWVLPVAQLPSAPAEPNVYEDYFPLGTISPELCPLHAAAADTASATPVVAPASYPTRRIVIERTVRSDGTGAIVMKGGGP